MQGLFFVSHSDPCIIKNLLSYRNPLSVPNESRIKCCMKQHRLHRLTYSYSYSYSHFSFLRLSTLEMQISRIWSLGIVYVCYLFIGALLFKKLESKNKLEMCETSKAEAKEYKNRLVGKTFYKFKYHLKLCQLLKKYIKNIRKK